MNNPSQDKITSNDGSFILIVSRSPRLHYAEDMLPAGDNQLVQIVNAATADAARRSGDWLKCRPGCTQCCIGVFPITQLDALRLRQGLADLELIDPLRAGVIRGRARESMDRLKSGFPGDPQSGQLD